MKKKLIFGVVATAVLIALWVVTASFTGNEMGETCNGDGDCKGMNAACVSGPEAKYCTIHCDDGAACPTGYTCSTVQIMNIDGQGKTTEGGTSNLCTK